LSKRLDAVRELLEERALDAVLVTHPNNRFYLSGYAGEDDPPNESAGVLLISRDRAIILAPAINLSWAASEAKDFEAVAWRRPWEASVAEQAQALGAKRLGIEEDAILLSTTERLKQQLDGAIEIEQIGDVITDLRSIKDADEVELLEATLKLTDDVFVASTQDLKPGTTERELAWTIERTMREMGADGPAFHTIVASGPHSVRPHHSVTDRAIEPGEPVVIDMGTRALGYNGDLTRTIWLGEPSSKLKDVYNVVLDAQLAALQGISAGITGKEADALARDIISAAGYGEYFTHGLGHGLGVRVHASPSASSAATNVLRAGEVLTVEPGIYIPDWGGVRIEDVVLIEDDGACNLTSAPKHPRF
jgi:Xaa-Pro aminopeptidase